MRPRPAGQVRVVVLALIAGLLTLPATADAAVPPQPPPDIGSGSTDPGRLVTLITGDVIRVTGTGDKQNAKVEVDAEPLGDVSITRVDDTLYAVPGVAGMLLAKDALDPRLFNLTELLNVAEHSPASGFSASAAMTTLPVIVQYDGNKARKRAAPNLPPIDANAVEVATDKAASFWSDLTDQAKNRASGPTELTLAPGIKKVWLNGVVHTNLDVSRNTVGAEAAWAAGYDGTGVKVAVLDTGVDTNHPDLADRVVLEKSFVPGETPHDGHFHGTHVSSILAGSGVASNGQYTGVAPGARLLNGKVLSNQGYGTESAIIEGMEWAAANGADIVSMSIGGSSGSDGKSPMEQALNRISRTDDVLFVVAAGNDFNAPQSLNSPGAADLALTVANVARDGSAIDSSSSVGPRVGDIATKPEISAPGTNIMAAAAGGGYMPLTGTSMATPHVAASAAILLQRHPDWSAQQLKDTLIATATPTSRDPIYWQGAGVVRADRAVETPVTATGSLNLGTVPFPQNDGQTVSGTARYTNTTNAEVTLDLSANFQQAPRGFTRDATPFTPPAGSVTIPQNVVVPAGGTADVPVTVDVSRLPYASVFGRLVATVGGRTVTTTLLSWTRETELHQLKLRAIDRDGQPLVTVAWSFMWLWDLQTGAPPRYVAFSDGVGRVQGYGTDPRMEPGRYSLMGYIGGAGPAPRFDLRTWTFVAEPEIVLDQARAYTFDARLAGQVRLRTQRYTSGGMGESFLVRKIPGHELSVQPGEGMGGAVPRMADELYTLGGGKASTGTFEWKNFTSMQRPPFIFHVRGDDRPIPGRLPSGRGVRLLPDGSQRVVDVGAGAAPDTTAAGLPGALAVWRPTSTWDGYIRGAADEVAAAGAKGLVIVPPADMRAAARGPRPEWPTDGKVPVAVVWYDDAAGLTAAARRGERVRLDSGHPSEYAYFVVTRQQGGLTNGKEIRVNERDMVRRDVRYKGDPATFCGHSVVADRDQGPTFMLFDSTTPDTGHYCGVARQEFFSPGVLYEVYRNSPGLAYLPNRPDIRWANSELSRVQGKAGDRRGVDIGAGPWVPGYSGQHLFWGDRAWATTGLMPDGPAFNFQPGSFTSGPDEWNFLNAYPGQFSATARLTRADGSLVCESPYGVSNDACRSTTPGRYQLALDVAQDLLPLSRKTHSVWDFTMTAPPAQGNAVVQPVMMLDWTLGTDMQNRVTSTKPTTVAVTPYFAKGYPYRDDFRATLSVSYDDGVAWTKVATDKADAGSPLEFRVPPPRSSNGYVSYRVTVTDDNGNSIEQTVIKAAYAPTP
jgi:subtilisin family serine protease